MRMVGAHMNQVQASPLIVNAHDIRSVNATSSITDSESSSSNNCHR